MSDENMNDDPNERTAIIFHEEDTYFYILAGNMSRFNNVLINQYSDSIEKDELQKELNDIMYNENGYLKYGKGITLREFLDTGHLCEYCITCGFIF